MHIQRIVHSLAGTAVAAAGLVATTSPAAHAADLDVDIYRRPAYVAPAPRVYVAPARVVTIGPACVTRRRAYGWATTTSTAPCVTAGEIALGASRVTPITPGPAPLPTT